MTNLRRLGQEAEDRAAEYLISEGFTIVTRRYKARHGEIDIVALDEDVLVFVEVKHRRGSLLPEEAITATKTQSLIRASEQYVVDFEVGEKQTRFDVIAMDRQGLRHYRNALSVATPIEKVADDGEVWTAE